MELKKEHDPKLRTIVGSILESYEKHGELTHLEDSNLPSRAIVWAVVEDLLRILFPGFLETEDLQPKQVVPRTTERVHSVAQSLGGELEKGLLSARGPKLAAAELRARAQTVTLKLLTEIPSIRDVLATDIEAAYQGDPAAQSLEEIIIAYPGLQAIAVYRLAHVLYENEIPLVPRVMTEYAHSNTGIDIHPGAKVGRSFFIDHGTGMVVGETCTIGDGVKIYQGVTLGARGFPRDEKGRIVRGHKRHPDIEDAVTIYSGATILGDVTVGEGSLVGGNVWLTGSIPADTKIIVRPPQQVHIERGISDYQI